MPSCTYALTVLETNESVVYTVPKLPQFRVLVDQVNQLLGGGDHVAGLQAGHDSDLAFRGRGRGTIATMTVLSAD